MQFTPSHMEHGTIATAGMVSEMILYNSVRLYEAEAMPMTEPYHRKSFHIIQENGPYNRYINSFWLAHVSSHILKRRFIFASSRFFVCKCVEHAVLSAHVYIKV